MVWDTVMTSQVVSNAEASEDGILNEKQYEGDGYF